MLIYLGCKPSFVAWNNRRHVWRDVDSRILLLFLSKSNAKIIDSDPMVAIMISEKKNKRENNKKKIHPNYSLMKAEKTI